MVLGHACHMGPTRRTLLASTASLVSLGVAGCTGLQSGGQQTTETTTATETTTTTTETTTTETTDQETTQTETTDEGTTQTGDILGIRSTDQYGDIVVGPDGLSLYVFERDPSDGSESVCTGDCADAWPPLTVEDEGSLTVGDGIDASVGTLERTDGTLQVTLGGLPLYYFQGDSAPGDVAGVAVIKAWWLIDPQGTPLEPAVQVRSHPEYGKILTGPDGLSLYMFDQDTKGGSDSSCTGGCADAWSPLTVSSDSDILASPSVDAPVGTITRMDGSTQVTVDGWPVYHFQNDTDVGDVNGQGVQDAWWLLGADGSVMRSMSGDTTTTTESDDDGGRY